MKTTLEMNMQNIIDFHEEWITLCGTSDALQGKTLFFCSRYPELQDVGERIFAAHGAAVQRQAEIHIYFDETLETICGASASADHVIAVFTEAVASVDLSCLRADCKQIAVIRTPWLYGAGLSNQCGMHDSKNMTESLPLIHVVDVFRLLLRNVAAFQPGHYTAWECATRSGTHDGIQYYTPVISREEGLKAVQLLSLYPNERYYDATSYGGKLRQLQLLQLKCLIELDRICREHNISYFLGGGTLLGAVRHHGFIPWDDDIDVMMTRENFDRFAQIAPKAAGEAFFFQNVVTDPCYHSPFAKLRLKDTIFMTPFSSRFPDMHNEIFIDIFAHDAAPKNVKLAKLHIFFTLLARSMVFHKWENTPLQFYGKWKAVCRIMSIVMRHCSMLRLEKWERCVMTFWNKRNTGFLYDGMGEHTRHGVFPASILDESIKMEFEGYWFPVPVRYDAYLQFSYGEDYMRWPRPGLRNSHHKIAVFSLGKYES